MSATSTTLSAPTTQVNAMSLKLTPHSATNGINTTAGKGDQYRYNRWSKWVRSCVVTGSSRKEIRTKVPDILRLTGLSTKLHNYPDQLSGGEKQRVSVARAFVNHPPLLLADEPTGNLDPETSIGIMQLLYRINRTGTTVVVATHDHAMVDKMRRRVIELAEGRIIRDEAAGLYARDETTREFAARMRGAVADDPDAWLREGDDDEGF